MIFNHIAIVGVGLIGGSFALAARRAGIALRITGWDNPQAISKARDLGAIDDFETAFDEGRQCGADLIYLAAPVGGIIEFLNERADLVKVGAIVTDAGSTKREICRVARARTPQHSFFIGGHPLAGSHRTGIDFASSDLFQGAAYALASDGPMAGAEQTDALNKVIEMVRQVGANPILMSAEDHDRLVARTSHAPQLVSTALALLFTDYEARLKLSGSGLADMMRLAASDWSVWEDICSTNADEIDAALAEFIEKIEALRVSISTGKMEAARTYFREANELMRRFHSRKAIMIEDKG